MGRSELLVYVVIFIAVAAFNYVMKMLAQRARQMQERQQAAQEELRRQSMGDDEPEAGELDAGWGRSGQAAMPAAAEAPEAPASRPAAPRAAGAVRAASARSARRSAATELLRSRENLRNAIVVMAVLGPPRALKPHDQ
ncbi:MAG: hypothetical protein KJZ83_01410 [Burkholderiaceae bacterium]|nr:hypothetical protein [Burkholderiaceae bacterium]